LLVSGKVRDLGNLQLVTQGVLGGWYHNVAVGNSSTWEIFGRRDNSPLVDPRGHQLLWEEFARLLSSHADFEGKGKTFLKGKRVMDIGPAEGLFTLAALADGAEYVEVVQPESQLLHRFEKVMIANGYRDRVKVHVGYFPRVGFEVVDQVDVLFVLGVVYHAHDCESFIRPLLSAGKPVCWEFMYALSEPKNFDPKKHNDSQNGLFSRKWLESMVSLVGHEVLQCSDYNERCLRPGYLAQGAADGGWSRAAFVSLPRSAVGRY